MSDIIVAPFSNGLIRDWPGAHFSELIRILIDRWEDGSIRLIGTAGQVQRANPIVRLLDPSRVTNECGRRSWPEVLNSIRSAACVVGNNSGIAHLAGHFGVPTVCIFGGSHQRQEWRPLGDHVTVLTRSVGCSPCHLDHRAQCQYDKACLTQIEPAIVADVVLGAIRGGGRKDG